MGAVARKGQRREKASAIKRHTITHLDEYLDKFATKAEENGCIVHWAKDANEFNEIVYGILKNHNVKKLVKSKSMLTEECGMNPYLEEHGIEVVETDLGERIIQLKGQAPSHIVMPAIHLNHDDVGELFEEKLGSEKGNHDPTYLTYVARLSLRNEFLTAGKCRHVDIVPETAHRCHRTGEGDTKLRLSGSVPAHALQSRNRTAHHNIYESLPQGTPNGRTDAHSAG